MDLRDILNAMKADPFKRIILGAGGWICGGECIAEAQQEWLVENGFIESEGFINSYEHFKLTERGRTVDVVDYMLSQ